MPTSSIRFWRRRSFGWGLAAAAVQSALISLIAGPRLRVGIEDTDLYYRYATQAWQGRVPYRDFLVEYPPLALPFFFGPAAVSRGVVDYKVAFAAEMLLINALAVLLVAALVEQREGWGAVRVRLAWYTLIVVILSQLIVTRYDAAPMLISFAAMLWWTAGRGTLGGGAAALGTATKVYPAAVALVAIVGDWKRPADERYRGLTAFALTALILAMGWLGLGGMRGVMESIRFHSGRGFEYGSLYSGTQMLAAKLVAAPITISRDHASFSTITPWTGTLLKWVFPVQGATILGVCWVFARRGTSDSTRYQAAAVLAFIATGKVFSPQFVIWLTPSIAILAGQAGRRARWLFLAICVATVAAPGCLGFFPRTSLWVILAYNGRNVLVVWLLIHLVFGPGSARADSTDPRGGAGEASG